MKSFVMGAAGALSLLVLVVGVAWAGNIFTVDRDGTIRLAITDAGNVGIGTETPQSRLEVKGSGTTSATSALNITASDGTSRMYVRDDGNIGVGTTSPGSIFNVKSGSAASNFVLGEFFSALDGDGEFNTLRFGKSASGGQTGTIGYRYDTTSGDEGVFITLYGDGPGSGFFQKKGGNVGVGTTDPKTKLHVTGLPEYAGNAAAIAAGLTAGAFYRTGEILKVVY